MNALQKIRQWQSAAKTRRFLIAALIDLPLLIMLFLLSTRFVSQPFAIAVSLASAAIVILYVLRSIEAFDDGWLICQLDQKLANLEDSSDLLFKQGNDLSSLQKLQHERIEQRVSS